MATQFGKVNPSELTAEAQYVEHVKAMETERAASRIRGDFWAIKAMHRIYLKTATVAPEAATRDDYAAVETAVMTISKRLQSEDSPFDKTLIRSHIITAEDWLAQVVAALWQRAELPAQDVAAPDPVESLVRALSIEMRGIVGNTPAYQVANKLDGIVPPADGQTLGGVNERRQILRRAGYSVRPIEDGFIGLAPSGKAVAAAVKSEGLAWVDCWQHYEAAR